MPIFFDIMTQNALSILTNAHHECLFYGLDESDDIGQHFL